MFMRAANIYCTVVITINQSFNISLLYVHFFIPMFYDFVDNYHHQLFINAVKFGSTLPSFEAFLGS